MAGRQSRSLTRAQAFSADVRNVDDTVIFARDDGLYRVSAGGGGSVERLTPRAGQGYIAPHVLPGGKAVVFYLRKGLIGPPIAWPCCRWRQVNNGS